MIIKLKPLLYFTLGTLAVGGISAAISAGAQKVYEQAEKPALSPPAWLFPVVWTILFILMGISAYLVWSNDAADETLKKKALVLYFVQLAVNFFWPILFFNLQAYFFAFIWLLILLALVIATVVLFHRIRPLAAYLQIPYILWLIFAAYLNFMVFKLN
ncbi:MAG: tryptophan-rich sensory protein [Clostridia bacterium]|nr:tryptophan-rich sensory protein [Clostridia bacterium]